MSNTATKKQRKYKVGDIIQLGKHLLIYGDATKVDLPKEVKIRSIVTDPPYGVAYVENKDFTKLGKADCIPIAGDQLQSETEYRDFTKAWLERAIKNLDSYNTVYIFHADLMTCAIRAAMSEVKYFYSQIIIWIKNTNVLGRKDYLPQHEMIAYGWYGRHKMERGKGKSVMFYSKPAKSKIHPTMKPVGLVRKLVLNSTKQGEWVYDPFGGSGSTLIACEQTKRRCLMVEMEPTYIDTIVERWEKLSKQKATMYGKK